LKHLAVAAILLWAVLLNSDSNTPDSPVATYSHGVLHVAVGRGPGRLDAEVLNPEGEVIGRATAGTWQADVKLATPLSTEELVWHRLHYRFTPSSSGTNPIEGTASISQILRTPVVHIIGQQSFLAGGEAAVRVAATDLRNEPISGEGSVNVELRPAGKSPIPLFSGRLNRNGTAQVQFRLPAGITGRAPLRYTVETAIGGADFTQEIRIEPKSSVLLTTEKPIYQPGQTIHVRALALDRASHQATAGRPITFEIEDSKGNKVFKRSMQTDTFGVSSAEFTLADEVNLGTYHLRAAMDGTTAEIALNVDRYVLPKFKVAVELSNKTSTQAMGLRYGWYRPGDHVTGTVRAHYFFGEAVSGKVTVKASGMDVEMFDAASAAGELGVDGSYRFDLKLPDFFAGRPLDQGAARVLVEAAVTDSAGHEETRGEPVTVSQSPLLLTAVPEGGTLVPNLENEVFVLASYPDGTPAAAQVRAAGQNVTTDAGGVAVVRLKPGVQAEKLQIEASDGEGNRATANVTLAARGGADQVLLRTERAVYRAGDAIRLRVFSTKARGTVYVDVVKSGQTVLTRDVDLANGQAELSLTATPDLAGTLDCNAYVFGQDARPVADHRLLFVQPADELKIEATTDRAVYRPGEDAKVRFRVTNARGEGVQAALGVQVVDEAVFALAEKQPGFAKVFFYLEQEVMRPRYEIHGIDMAGVVTAGGRPLPDGRGSVSGVRAGRALFAATEMVNPNRFDIELGRTAPSGKKAEYLNRYRAAFVAQVKKLVQGTGDGWSGPVAAARDAWEMRLEVRGYSVRSAGPDGKFGTEDDLAVFVNARTKDVVMAIGRGGGGVGGAINGLGRPMVMMAMAQPAPMAMGVVARDAAMVKAEAAPVAITGAVAGAAPATHVRSYFPEALYVNPEIVTDGRGNATVAIPLADSITTWRMALMASTARGALGSGASGVKVFQDFFVDLDLPVTLTEGDRVSIPVAVYNYSGASGEVTLRLEAGDWYGMSGDTAEKSVRVEAGKVGGASFTIEAKRIGKFKLALRARMDAGHGPALQDIVVREIEVAPNGRELTTVFNGRLEGAVEHAVVFPAGAIADASKVFVRLYPGPLSQVIEGMDAILRMPFGCFEQTSSATYPNVLALDYMKRTKKLTPEVHAKAEGFIATGYQRLLTYEVPGGGFSWFGQAPANKILTSYGLMEFHDMAGVHDVDAKVIQRTQQWLAAQQQADGSWKPDMQFINEGATNRFNSDALRITAYIGWALENTEYRGAAVAKAREFVQSHMDGKADAYTLAVVANLAAESGDREFARRAVQLLMDARTEKDDLVWWTADETGMYARGASAAVETTGLAVQALLKAGLESGTAGKALKYIASKKDAQGTWGTTQATIMALRALLLSMDKGAADVSGTVEITLNGRPAGTLTLTADNNDLLHQFALPGIDQRGANRVALKFTGKGGLAYQVAGRYYVPWDGRMEAEPLTIDVQYDRTRLAQNDVARATATVKSNLRATAKMVMVDLGIPPGFELLTEDLESYKSQSAGKASGRLEKYTMTATQAILYFDSIGAGETVKVEYRLRAKFPMRAKTFASRVYEYYDPSVGAVARPVEMEVQGRR
jgi:alpha-2-macroglobulin-like protein